MIDFSRIYLSWRKGQGSRRFLVGLLERLADGSFRFQYNKAIVEDAKKDGFTCYTELPDIDKTYNGMALQVFSQRLMKAERPDIQTFHDFWEIDPAYKSDTFYLLGHTQGLLPTDNFEMLADYQLHSGLHFLTELAGVSHHHLPADLLIKGDPLSIKKEAGNEHDGEAVQVLKGTQPIGYIKKVHCKVFHQPDADRLQLSVKAVEKNGVIRKVFIKVAYMAE